MNEKKKYLTAVSDAIPHDFSQRKQYLRDITSSVNEYCSKNTNISFNELCRQFGSAAEIAESFAVQEGGETLVAKHRKTKNKKIIFTVVTAIILFLSAVFVFLFYEVSLANTGSYTENIVINQKNNIDLKDESQKYFGTIPIANDPEHPYRFLTEVEQTNATKEICYRNKKNDLLFKVTVTNNFFYPSLALSDSISEIQNQEPQIIVEVLDKKYTVQTKDIVKEKNSVHLTLVVQNGKKTEEKEITFYADEKGNLY